MQVHTRETGKTCFGSSIFERDSENGLELCTISSIDVVCRCGETKTVKTAQKTDLTEVVANEKRKKKGDGIHRRID